MKYIILYESYTRYYQEISTDEYNNLTLGSEEYHEENGTGEADFISRNWGTFTNAEISQIMLYFPSEYKYEITRYGMMKITNDTRNTYGVCIIKLKDEWFCLHEVNNSDPDPEKSYKCDQFDGLKKLLRHNSYHDIS